MFRKSIQILSISAFALLFACNSNQQHGDRNDSTLTEKSSPLAKYFYKRLEGTVAGQPVVMQLNKVAGGTGVGSYYYTEQGREINLMLDTLVNSDSLILREYILGEPNVGNDSKIGLKWNGKGFTGSFTAKDGMISPVDLKEVYPTGSYQFTTDSVTDSKPAMTDKPDGPKADFFVQYLSYKGKNEQWMNNQLKTLYNIKNNEDWKTALKKHTESYFKDYESQVKDNADLIKAGESIHFLNYETATNNYVRFNDKDFIVIEAYGFAYTGGAHGNYNSAFFNYDIANQKVLKLSDVVKVDSVALNKIAETQFRKQAGLKATDALTTVLFDKTFKINDNFYINSKGLTFLYNPYEIASYAQGQIDVFIPYEAFGGLLNPDFKKRIGI